MGTGTILLSFGNQSILPAHVLFVQTDFQLTRPWLEEEEKEE